MTNPHRHPALGRAGSEELSLLLCCARVETSPAQHARIVGLLEEPMDWERIFALARRHKMMPLLAYHMRGYDARLADNVRVRLHAFTLQNAARVLQVVGELVVLLKLFSHEGISAVPYKGVVLAAQLYGNVALRPAGDIDILVRRDDALRARALLIQQGYHPRHAVAADSEAFMVASRYSDTLEGMSPYPVELHWAFTNRDIAFPLEHDDLLPRLQSVRLGTQAVSAFGAEDLLLLLCVHGSKHRWDRIEWICGVAEAVRQASVLDWEKFMERAARLGVRRMLLLAYRHLDAPVPSDVLRAAHADRAVSKLAGRVPALWLDPVEGEDADSLPVDFFRYNLRERWRDRVRFVLYRVATPSRPEDWSVVRVGRVVFPTHSFLRPFHLARAVVPAVRSLLRANRQRLS